MSDKSSSGFVTGLIVEGAVIGLVVTLLPKVPLGGWSAPREQIADQRPSLAATQVALEHLPPANWRTAVSRPQATQATNATQATQASPAPATVPPADPAYVERRLDEAGEQLLSGVTTYLSRHAQQVLQTPLPVQPPVASPAPLPPSYLAPSYTAPSNTAPSFHPPGNAFRY